ncbi:MAG: hypothetical protein DMF92_06015 [Acidobacteria bacterium]|nr:MAG: hypothetical protein DMF92_06015 [Acidobacteriota bacterium]
MIAERRKLGIIVSERTASRCLPDRLTRRSQTWRTFLANHIGNLVFASTLTSSFATSDDDVDALVLRILASHRIAGARQKSTVTLNRANRGPRMLVGRSYAAPFDGGGSKTWLYAVPVYELNRL